MNINKLLDNLISRYSTNFLVWALWLFIFVIAISLLLIQIYGYYAQPYYAQPLIWFIIIYGDSVIVPVLCTIVLCIYHALYLTEKKYDTFRIHCKYSDNIIYKILFFATLITSFIMLIFFAVNTIFTIVLNKKIDEIFITIGIPIMLSIIPFYFFFVKLLQNKVSKNSRIN